jgi:hypothetical protein
LKNNAKRLEDQGEKILKELQTKGDELLKDKLERQKNLNETTYKLNEYLKEFPDH